jgi:hypothetical protein
MMVGILILKPLANQFFVSVPRQIHSRWPLYAVAGKAGLANAGPARPLIELRGGDRVPSIPRQLEGAQSLNAVRGFAKFGGLIHILNQN